MVEVTWIDTVIEKAQTGLIVIYSELDKGVTVQITITPRLINHPESTPTGQVARRGLLGVT